MQYSVVYIIERYLQVGDEHIYRPEGRALTVQANSRVEAFILAYRQLTAQGNLVCTAGEIFYDLILDDKGVPRSRACYEGLAGLSSEDMESIYRAGVPINRPGLSGTAMTHIESIREFSFADALPGIQPSIKGADSTYISVERLNQLRAVQSPNFDLTRLLHLCEEINICIANDCFSAVAILTRAIVDHIPPVFGFTSFAEVVNNYAGSKSFKEHMQHLQISSRKVADAQLHTPIRRKESVPTFPQVNFASDIDVLLAEIVRILS